LSHSAWRRRLVVTAKIGLAGSLLVWLTSSDRLQLSRLAGVHLNSHLFALIALVAGSMFVPAIRWWWLLRIQGVREPLWRVLKLTWSGYLAALVMPGAASGDLARTYLILRQRDRGRARAFSTILADRFLGLHSLFCLGAFSIVWMSLDGRSDTVGWVLAATVVIPLLVMTISLAALLWCQSRELLFRVVPVRWRDAWDESFALYQANLPQLFGCFGLSVLSSMMTVCALAIAGRLLGEVVAWNAAFLAGPLVVVANCLPVTPGGIGLAEAVSSELFSSLGFARGAGMMVLTRICAAIVTLPGLLPLLIPGVGRKRFSDESPAPQGLGVSHMFNDSSLTGVGTRASGEVR
jgi:glycosyltransferase 2 family protein